MRTTAKTRRPVTAKQIQESGARTVPDLLRLVAGVNVRWNPMVQTIDIRGFGENPFSNRILLLIDGSPYNSGDTGGLPLSPAFDFFPVQNIKRVEVVRGPGSAPPLPGRIGCGGLPCPVVCALAAAAAVLQFH